MVLWVVFEWNRCSEPSQALRASSPGGRAKGLVGVDGQWESQGCGGHRWTVGEPRVKWASMGGAVNFGLWGCLKFAHRPCFVPWGEVPLPKGAVGVGGRRGSQGLGGDRPPAGRVVGVCDICGAMCLRENSDSSWFAY